jgi:hypothetical protein
MTSINETLESEIDKELNELQENKPEMVPIEALDEAVQGAFDKQFKEYAERYLSSYNKYVQAKAVMDDLKNKSDAAEVAMISFARDIGVLTSEVALTYDGMGTFKIKEAYFGNVTKANRAKVFAFFRNQKRENEFFELSVRKAEVNKFVREKVDKCKKNSKGGEIEPDLPDGVSFGKKHSVSLSNRNSSFGV